jgi:hypothetical protein
MQTGVWMAYSCSSCFSDRNSYITLFISSYQLEGTNFASFKHLWLFSENRKTCRTSVTEEKVATVADLRDQGALGWR